MIFIIYYYNSSSALCYKGVVATSTRRQWFSWNSSWSAFHVMQCSVRSLRCWPQQHQKRCASKHSMTIIYRRVNWTGPAYGQRMRRKKPEDLCLLFFTSVVRFVVDGKIQINLMAEELISTQHSFGEIVILSIQSKFVSTLYREGKHHHGIDIQHVVKKWKR